jgi:hypothetical protein
VNPHVVAHSEEQSSLAAAKIFMVAVWEFARRQDQSIDAFPAEGRLVVSMNAAIQLLARPEVHGADHINLSAALYGLAVGFGAQTHMLPEDRMLQLVKVFLDGLDGGRQQALAAIANMPVVGAA